MRLPSEARIVEIFASYGLAIHEIDRSPGKSSTDSTTDSAHADFGIRISSNRFERLLTIEVRRDSSREWQVYDLRHGAGKCVGTLLSPVFFATTVPAAG